MKLAIDRAEAPDDPTSPEQALLAAVLKQAVDDLRSSNAEIAGEAAQFFSSTHGSLPWFALALDLPASRIRALAQ
ncbi:MAG: hypothetical protein AB7R40_25275 [Nitrospiraceae bacterium]